MTLSSFVKHPDVRLRMREFRPKIPRRLLAEIRVEPRIKGSYQNSLIGTAFDILLRFELKRRKPTAAEEPWFVERFLGGPSNTEGNELFTNQTTAPDTHDVLQEFKNTTRLVLNECRHVVNKFQNEETPPQRLQRDAAESAIRLAIIESAIYSGDIGRIDRNVEPEDIDELLRLLAVVPTDQFTSRQPLLLNPRIGRTVSSVHEAFADIIVGWLLLDVKTVAKAELNATYLDQILGYFLLAKREHQNNVMFPEIRQLGLYFSRHAFLWQQSTDTWTTREGFDEFEEWFLTKVSEEYAFID